MRRLFCALAFLAVASSPAFGASSYTACLRTENPVPGDPAVRNAWGTIENTGRSLLDTAIAGSISLSVAGSANVTLTTADGGADQSRNANYTFTGVLTGNINVFWPIYCRSFSVFNNTTGAFTLTAAVTGTPGTTVVVPQGTTMVLISDGTNIRQRVVGAVGGTGGTLTLPAGPDTLVARATTDTLTNKSISGATNTLSAIGNASLTNSSITIGGASTALGGTVTSTTMLDSIGATRGQVLFRGAATWTALATGTAGQFLRTGGAGADVTWVTGLLAANNLSDVASAATSRTNLGVTATGADTTYAFRANNLSDLGNAATARGNLGLGSIATHNYAIATVGAGCHTGGASGDVCYEY